MLEIMLADRKDFGKHNLFAVNALGAVFWWGSAPGSEPPREPTAAEKWHMLLRWNEGPSEHSLAEGDYWAFSPKGVSYVCTHPKRPHRPNEGERAEPKSDQKLDRTQRKGSG
jgi:hypothetical protein